MARKRGVLKEEEPELENNTKIAKSDVVEAKLLPEWQYIGGGTLKLKDGRVIKKGDTFFANEYEVKPIKNVLKELTPENEKAKVIRVPFYKLKEVEVTDEEKEAEGFIQKYVIVNMRGKNLTDTPMREEEAEKVLKALNE